MLFDLGKQSVYLLPVTLICRLLANYFGFSDRCVTPLEGILAAVSAGTQVNHEPGCELTGDSTAGFGRAVRQARNADVVIACMGLTARLEGEQGAAEDSDAGGGSPGPQC